MRFPQAASGRIHSTIVVLALLAAIIPSAGCQSLWDSLQTDDPHAVVDYYEGRVGDLEGAYEAADRGLGVTRQAIVDYLEQLEDLPEESPMAAWIRRQLTAAQDELAFYHSKTVLIDQQLAEARNALARAEENAAAGGSAAGVHFDFWSSVTGSAGAATGQPWLLGASAILGVLGTFFGVKKGGEAKAAKSEKNEAEDFTRTVVHSIEVGKKSNPDLASALHNTGAAINQALGPKNAAKLNAIRKGA